MCDFREGYEKNQLEEFLNGRLAAIIDINMRNILKTVPGSWTITIKQDMGFSDGCTQKQI